MSLARASPRGNPRVFRGHPWSPITPIVAGRKTPGGYSIALSSTRSSFGRTINANDPFFPAPRLNDEWWPRQGSSVVRQSPSAHPRLPSKAPTEDAAVSGAHAQSAMALYFQFRPWRLLFGSFVQQPVDATAAAAVAGGYSSQEERDAWTTEWANHNPIVRYVRSF